MGDERAGRRAAVDDLEHGGLQLEVVAAVEIVAQGAHDGGPGAHHVACGGADQQVELATARPVVLTQADLFALLVGPDLRQRAQGLGGEAPGGHDDVVIPPLGRLDGVGALAQDGLGHD